VYPGFSASEVLIDGEGSVRGVATRDMGIDKEGNMKDSFERGIELRARQTILSEGCRGSCSEFAIDHFKLREGKDEQTYGLGVKEVWEIPEENCKPGFIQHSLGYPLQSSLSSKTFGGSFLYHMEPNLVLVGLVVGLDYENPHLSPYQEFQRLKHHPDISKHLKGGTCISYGARCLNEGGFHAIPKLTFSGGMLAGCSAGFLNAMKIKGTHTAMKSGMVAAEEIFNSLSSLYSETPTIADSEGMIPEGESNFEVSSYQQAMEDSWVWEELRSVRNFHGGFSSGMLSGMLHAGFTAHLTKGSEPWTFSNKIKDSDRTKPASGCLMCVCVHIFIL